MHWNGQSAGWPGAGCHAPRLRGHVESRWVADAGADDSARTWHLSCDEVRRMEPKIPDTAVCLGCGYSLRGLPEERCPECGRSFSWNDATTYRVQKAASSRCWFDIAIQGSLILATVLLWFRVLTTTRPISGYGVYGRIVSLAAICFSILSLRRLGYGPASRRNRAAEVCLLLVLYAMWFVLYSPWRFRDAFSSCFPSLQSAWPVTFFTDGAPTGW